MMRLSLFTLCAALACGIPAFAQEAASAAGQFPASSHHFGETVEVRDPAMHYPAGSIKSVEQADRALQDVKQEEARLTERFAKEEEACLSRFFVTACTDSVKERRRAAMARLNPIEVEANAFKRRDRVAQRDRVLSEQEAKEASRAPQRVSPGKENEAARSVAPPSSEDVAKMEERASAANRAQDREPFLKTNDLREAQHQEKERAAQAKRDVQAAKRAENARNYEKKVKRSEERQRKVAERMAQKEEEQKRKAAVQP